MIRKNKMVSYEHKVKNIYLGEPEHHLVYDFQNDGQLGFTASGDGNSGYDSSQGLYHYSSTATNAYFYNNSIFDGNILKRVKIRGYLSGYNAAIGLCETGGSGYLFIRYEFDPKKVRWSAPNSIGCANNNTGAVYATVGQYIGEVVIDLNFENDMIYGEVNGTNYTLNTSLGTNFINLWNTNKLCLMFDDWNTNSKSYIRKVEITTQNSN